MTYDPTQWTDEQLIAALTSDAMTLRANTQSALERILTLTEDARRATVEAGLEPDTDAFEERWTAEVEARILTEGAE